MLRWPSSSRLALLGFLTLSALALPPRPARAQASNGARSAPDGLGAAQAAVRARVARLSRAIEARDANTWKLLGLDLDNKSDLKNLTASIQVGQVGFSSDGDKALARYALTVWGSRHEQSTLLKRTLQDLVLVRSDASWNLAAPAWAVPDPTLDTLQELADAARNEWEHPGGDSDPDAAPAGEAQPLSGPRAPEVFHMVVERRGGRWIGLRHYAWDGRVLKPQTLAARERAGSLSSARPNAAGGAQNGSLQWLKSQLDRWARIGDGKGGGTLHLLLQNGARDWVGLDSVWEPRLSEAPEAVAAAGPAASDERSPAPLSDEASSQAASLRAEIADDPIVFGDAAAHKRLAQVLEGCGLFGEAADEWEKAALLASPLAPPGTGVSAARLAAARTRRAWDPRARTISQLTAEQQVGQDQEIPRKLVALFKAEQSKFPTPLRALRIGLEYSKSGDDASAAIWLQKGRQMIAGGWRLSPDDEAWAQVLDEHLEQRTQLARVKPPNLLSSGIFIVRCRLDDLSVLPLLAALEAAQHTVYGDFGIPMGSTEVVLWPDQSAFQSYTTRFSSQGASEFVAALTLTKLIATASGPWVLGEEVNVFVDPRLADATFGTVAHEYGHVAVRQMSKGRTVPVWFNEGLATVVEGGYDGAIERVRTARRANRLLSMDAMRQWNVDGERAFLAYSQANSMVDFIIATWGSQAVLDILRQIGQDVPPEQAFAKVLHINTNRLWQQWTSKGIR